MRRFSLSLLLLASLWPLRVAAAAGALSDDMAFEPSVADLASFPRAAESLDLLRLLGRSAGEDAAGRVRIADADPADERSAPPARRTSVRDERGDVVHSFRAHGEHLLHYATAPPSRR